MRANLFVAMIVMAGASGVPAAAEQVFKDQYVTVERPGLGLVALLNPHMYGDPDYTITVAGRRYPELRGRNAPFYARVPDTPYILFVTTGPKKEREGSPRALFHFFNTQDKTEIVIDGGPSGFGAHPVSAAPPGAPFTDYVERVALPQVWLAIRTERWKVVLTVNLATKRLERGESVQFDEKGAVIKRYEMEF